MLLAGPTDVGASIGPEASSSSRSIQSGRSRFCLRSFQRQNWKAISTSRQMEIASATMENGSWPGVITAAKAKMPTMIRRRLSLTCS